MAHPGEHLSTASAGDVEMGNAAEHPAPASTLAASGGQSMKHRRLGRSGTNKWLGNNPDAVLVVATLITTLTYQLGTNIPGGYWQDTQLSDDGKQVPHLAGDPIMRDLHRPRYWAFMAASWIGFGSSMVMTLSLLVRMPVESRHVRWSFVVAYSSLVLTFIVSQPRTHLSIDIIVWVAVLAILWIITSFRPCTEFIRHACTTHDS